MPQDYSNHVDSGEDFWGDLDALKSMLDEEDRDQGRPQWTTPDEREQEDFSHTLHDRFDVPGETRTYEKAPARDPYAGDYNSFQPDFGSGFGGEAYEEEVHHHHAQSHSHSADHSSHHHSSRKKSSKGAIITLYVVIFLELAAIAGIGASWYLWMQ